MGRRGEIETEKLVTTYPISVSHFASASLHLQSTGTHLQLCPFPDSAQLNLSEAEALCKTLE